MNAIIWIILATFSIFLLGCNAPQVDTQERMTASISFNFGTQEQVDNYFESIEKYRDNLDLRKQFISDTFGIFGSCYTHPYDVLKFERIGDVVKKPMSYCKDVTGFSKEAWATTITPQGKKFAQWVEDECKKNKQSDFKSNVKSQKCKQLYDFIENICIESESITYERSLRCDQYLQLINETCF